ncbi:hypothetical protein [Serratia marcescens]|uniref:hypothetical protein n=1 Tax=Serratia marcescens TaxID=615 RepID=UPI0021BDD744|nr:hypothetical protein [Serratia marcescens]
MNLEALDYIVSNEVEIIEDAARSAGVNIGSAVGVSKKVAAEKTDERLSSAQKYVFDRAVRPLIENITCSGNWNQFDDDPHCGNPIPESQLYDYYANDETLCESCQSSGSHLREQLDKARDA